MTLTNHLLTGAALGKFLPLPIAVPLALISHFILDALPHFGFKSTVEQMKHLRLLKLVIALDFILAVGLSIWLARSGHTQWLLTGLVAYSPDLIWVYRFVFEEKFGTVEPTPGNWFVRFHTNIQKYERIWGIGIEVLYGLLLLVALR